MKKRLWVYLIAATTMLAGFSAKVSAEEVPSVPPKELKEGCGESGGIYLPPTQPSGTWGCVTGNGTIILCGGQSPGPKPTCTVASFEGKNVRSVIVKRLKKKAL